MNRKECPITRAVIITRSDCGLSQSQHIRAETEASLLSGRSLNSREHSDSIPSMVTITLKSIRASSSAPRQ